MNGAKNLAIVGVYRPREQAPGFGIPIFSDQDELCMQEIGENGVVLRFVPCDIDLGSLRKASEIRQSIGEPGLYAFEAVDGSLVIATRAKLEEVLKAAV